MMDHRTTKSTEIDVLRRPDGTFAMLAIDQRESLRTMIADGSRRRVREVGDAELSHFKTTAARVLTPFASGVLVDSTYGRSAAVVAACPIILAADVLHQAPGGPVTGSSLDEGVTPDVARETGAQALKMLVIWTPDSRSAAAELATEFMEKCRRFGLPGIVEGVVHSGHGDTWSDVERDAAIVHAAADLAAADPDLYKAEVPSHGTGNPERITATSRLITEAVQCPWVVLSSGVSAADFPSAVSACAQGGASGFLAGRAVWADSLTAKDPALFLETMSTRRLEVLIDAATKVQD